MTTVKELKDILETLNDSLIVKVFINNELVELGGVSVKKSSDVKNMTLYASINPIEKD